MAVESPHSFLGVAPPADWGCQFLDDLVDKDRGISYGIVQPGKHDDSGIPVVRINNLRNGGIQIDDVLRVSPAVEASYERTRLRGGEVLLSLVGTLGECAVVPQELAGWNVARAVAVIPVKNELDPNWIVTCLRSQQLQHLIRTWATTTVQATLNLRDVRRLPIVLPPQEDIESMMQVISAFNDKIEINRRMNRATEKIARGIFKAWFIDFEPVKAKEQGAASFPGMPQAIFEQLPDRISESEHGAAPDGWSFLPIGELVDVVGGGTPSTKDPRFWNGGGNAFCTPKDMSRLEFPVLLDTERHIAQAGVDKISSGQLPVGTVLLSSRAPIGYLALAATPVSVNQGIIAMKTDAIPNSYVLLWTQANMDVIRSRAGGSTFAEISKRNFRPIPVLRPDDETLQAFSELTDPLFALITKNERETHALASTRDALLPALISGNVRLCR
jgi:type I restriction enzyme S subunit